MLKQILLTGSMGASVFLLVVLSARMETVDRLITDDREVEPEGLISGVSLMTFSRSTDVWVHEIPVHHRSTLYELYFRDLAVEK